MINRDKLRLPVCAMSAGAAHLAVLALVLPMLITLPAPSESMTPSLAAIPVEILPEAPPAPPLSLAQPPASPAQPDAIVAPDAIGALLENVSVAPATTPEPAGIPAAPDADDITGSLPEPSVMNANGQEDALVEAAREIANVDVVLPPRPTRVRRDAEGNALSAVSRAAPAAEPVRRAVPKRRRASRRPVAAKPDAAPFQGSWNVLLGKPLVNPIDKRTR